MRLFVALSITAQVRENLAMLIRELRSVDPRQKWVNPENLHVTLKFIGEVGSEKLAEIGDALATARTTPQIICEFYGVGFFPNERRPNVAWVGIRSDPSLSLLAGEVNRSLQPLGIPREEKPFVPHLSIARFKETRMSEELRAEIAERKNQSFGSVAANEFYLMESKTKSAGAEYTTLRSFRFAPQGSQRPELWP
jgi:2'-5' RNA ligase